MTWKTSKRWAHIRPTRRTPYYRWSRQIYIQGGGVGVYANVDPTIDDRYRATMRPWHGNDHDELGDFLTVEEAQTAAWNAALAWARDRGYKETP